MKILLTIFITTIVVLFALQNFNHVPIFFFVSKPVHIRLFFLIIFSGVIGYLIRFITSIQREEYLKRKLKKVTMEYSRVKESLLENDEI